MNEEGEREKSKQAPYTKNTLSFEVRSARHGRGLWTPIGLQQCCPVHRWSLNRFPPSKVSLVAQKRVGISSKLKRVAIKLIKEPGNAAKCKLIKGIHNQLCLLNNDSHVLTSHTWVPKSKLVYFPAQFLLFKAERKSFDDFMKSFLSFGRLMEVKSKRPHFHIA